MPPSSTALAAAVHDPAGNLVPAIERLAPRLTETFAGIALNISDVTAPPVAAAAKERLGAEIIVHPQGEETIGRIRRDAVRLALGHPTILYSDFDHMLRWIEGDPQDLRRILDDSQGTEFLVVGRSARALAAGPRRLQETERLVNHVHALLTGEDWDLMFAVRRMLQQAAETVVAESRVDTLANDAEWPLLARRAGLSLGYAESDALFYRTIEEFGAPADTGDGDPLQWIRRLEFAALQATAMRAFLPAVTSLDPAD
jgi:hypothetical protein